MGLQTDRQDKKEMKTIAIILLFAASCLADAYPGLMVNVKCRGSATSCRTSHTENSANAEGASVTGDCGFGANCDTEVREKGQRPSDTYQIIDNSKTNVNNNCRNGANCRTGVFGKRDVASRMRAFRNRCSKYPLACLRHGLGK